VSSVLVAAHRSLSNCNRNRKYPNTNNTILVVKIIANVANVFQFVSIVNLDACALTNQCLLSAEALRDEIVCCPVLAVSASLSHVAAGSRTVRLSERYQAGRYAEC